MTLDEMSKEDVADLAASLFNFQLLGPTILLDIAEKYPWLVERVPKRWEMEAILDLARRGKTINERDDEHRALCMKLREKYSFETQVDLWERDETAFSLVVHAALSVLYYREKVARALGQTVAMLRCWEIGESKPDPEIQGNVVQALRRMIREQREEE